MKAPEKICLVEDTEDLRTNVREFLEMEGFEIWEFRNAQDALAKISTELPDLIITDLWMPVMDGLTFIDQLKRSSSSRQVPVIIFTAKPLQEYEAKAKQLGVLDYVHKPASLEDLLQKIRKLI